VDLQDITRLSLNNIKAYPLPAISCLVVMGIYLVLLAAVRWRDHREGLRQTHVGAEVLQADEAARIFSMSFAAALKYQAVTNFTHRHWWLALFFPHRTAVTSGPERLSCLMSLVLGSMATNAVFFGRGSQHIASIGTISLVSACMLGPVRLVFRLCFLKTENRHDHARAARYQAAGKSSLPIKVHVSAASQPADERVTAWNTEKAQSGEKLLPYGCRVFAYIFLAVWSTSCMFMILVYGLQFDLDSDSSASRRSAHATTSDKWVVSVGYSTLLVQHHPSS
jgi:hypothetical protein